MFSLVCIENLAKEAFEKCLILSTIKFY